MLDLGMTLAGAFGGVFGAVVGFVVIGAVAVLLALPYVLMTSRDDAAKDEPTGDFADGRADFAHQTGR